MLVSLSDDDGRSYSRCSLTNLNISSFYSLLFGNIFIYLVKYFVHEASVYTRCLKSTKHEFGTDTDFALTWYEKNMPIAYANINMYLKAYIFNLIFKYLIINYDN